MTRNLKLLSLTIITTILNALYLYGNNESISTFKIPEKPIDTSTLQIINNCAERNTHFLKEKISNTSITRFKEYCSKKFRNSPEFPLAFFCFTQSNKAGIPGKWTLEHINDDIPSRRDRALNMLFWLKKNYTPRKNFSFFYLTSEPYFDGWATKQKTQSELSNLLDSCPLLISCNHPDLSWTKKAVLIPDDYILAREFYENIESLLSTDTYISMPNLLASPQKRLVPFSERKSRIYFRGIVSGPKYPFSIENMQENPRHYLLTLLKFFPYLDIGITDFNALRDKGKSHYLSSLDKKFSYLKCPRVDFFEHAKNKYLLSCDGYGAAWARPQLIMATGSVLFLNAQCEQYFYHLMKNNKTHIIINKNFSNLDAEFKKLENTPKLAEKIGNQGKKFAQRFFSKASIYSYLWLVLRKLEMYSPAF